jgi:hypothetical protein
MVLNPAWFNALVDDDGSGLTGTVWNKAVIKGLTDNIDSELTRLNYTQNFWTPGLVATSGTAAYTARTGFYGLIGKLCVMNFSIVFGVGTMAGGISIALPFPAVAVGVSVGGVDVPWFGGLSLPVSRLGTVIASGASSANIIYVAAAGATTIGYFEAGHLSAGSCEFKGSGAYLVA